MGYLLDNERPYTNEYAYHAEGIILTASLVMPITEPSVVSAECYLKQLGNIYYAISTKIVTTGEPIIHLDTYDTLFEGMLCINRLCKADIFSDDQIDEAMNLVD